MNATGGSDGFHLGVVILAAGASSRMGYPKPLLPWGGTTVIKYLLGQWKQLGSDQVVVVCAEANSAVSEELNRIGFPVTNRVINPVPERGMFSSIQYAARWRDWRTAMTHWAVTPGDQPQIQLPTLRRLIGFAAEHRERICQPRIRGRPRHPVILPRNLFLLLADACDQNLRQFLERHRHYQEWCEMDDPGLDLDIDTPADYDRALKLLNK